MLALAAALDQPSAGEVRAGERSLGQLDDDELAGFRARHVALVFQRANLWTALSARENVAVSLRLAGGSQPVAAAEEALSAFGLGGPHAAAGGIAVRGGAAAGVDRGRGRPPRAAAAG